MLENILIEYFNLSSNYNEIDEDTEKIEWENAYSNLVELIYDLARLGVIENADEIVDKLDKIESLEE